MIVNLRRARLRVTSGGHRASTRRAACRRVLMVYARTYALKNTWLVYAHGYEILVGFLDVFCC